MGSPSETGVSSSFLIDNLLGLAAASATTAQPSSRDISASVVVDLRIEAKKVESSKPVEWPTDAYLAIPTNQCQQEARQKLKLQSTNKVQPKGSGKRRTRTMFNECQLTSLEWRFARNKYLTSADRHRMAKLLQLNQMQVKTWFQVSC